MTGVQRQSRIAAAACIAIAIAAVVHVVAQDRRPEAEPAFAPVLSYEIVRSYPHDPDAFTQGLIYRDGFLYESTGLNGRSSLRKVRLESGDVVQRRAIDQKYFAEGLTDWRDRLIQLTWTSEIAFVYDLVSFAPRRSFAYRGQGWGLTHDDRRLVMSDGTTALRFLDPETFAETGRVSVSDGGRPIANLNELEFIEGRIYANVWLTDRIAIIAPDTGRVESWIDLTGLLGAESSSGNDVLNGIAYDRQGKRLFVTGKLWPKLFEIRLRGR
jgi:glutamine cyclotransferase